jgi:uncharacterized protein
MDENAEPRIFDNAEDERYELWIDDERAGVIEYETSPGVVVLIHTEIDPAFEGRGLGSKLIAAALKDIRDRGLGLKPICPFVRAYLDRHPEERDLVVHRSAHSG